MAEGIRVLCVDDEAVLLEMGKEYLEQSGEFSVDTALSARAALDILNKNSYDAIVSDYLMPEMNGIEFLKRVRATDKTTPFIIFTGRGREEVVIEALNNGADFYLQKGGDPVVLYQELTHVIRQSVVMKRTLTTLEEQEQRYHDIQNANDLIQSVAPDGHFLFVNKKWLDTLGYQEQDLQKLTLFDVIHDESLKHCMETFQRVISGENVGIIDAVFKDRAGKKVYVEGIANCKMVEGQPEYTRGIFKNVTERKELDAALKESETRYRNVVEDQTEFICRFRPDGTFVFVNDAYCRYFNKKRDEIIGKLYITNIPEEDRAGVAAIIALLTREHPVATTSNRVILDGGRVRWHQWSNRAIFGDDGKITEYQSVGRDITDLKEAEQELLSKNEDLNAAFEELTATEEELRHNYELISRNEQALRESEEKYRLLTEITDDVIYMIDVQGALTHISPRITRYGYTPDEVISRNFTEFIAKEDITKVLAEFKKTVSTGKSTVTTIRIQDKTGNLHWMEDNGAPVLDSSGSVVAISGILRDVSGRVKAEEALRESEETFRAMVEQSGEGIIIVNFTGMLQFANNMAWDIVEYPPDKRTTETFNVLDIVSPGMRLNAVADFLKVSRGIDSFEVMYKIITFEKNERWVECIGKKISFRGLPAMLLSIRDITQRRKTDDALRENEAKFRTIFDNSPYPISINSIPDGKFIEVNAAFLKSSGYEEAEILGKSPIELGLLSLLDYGKLSGHLLLSGKLENVPMVLRGKGEIAVHVQFSTIPITINNRSAIMTMAAEITKLKRVEEELLQKNEELRQNFDELSKKEQTLRESEEKFRALVEHSLDGILITDFTGNLLFANRAAGQIVDVPDFEQGIKKRNLLEFIAPEEKSRILHDFSKVEQGIDSYPVNYQVISASGRRIWIEAIGKRILFQDSPAILISMRDISSRKNMEVAMLRANKQLNLLSSITRHDINNQLQGLNGFVELLHAKMPDPTFEDYFTRITEASDQISAMIRFTKEYEQIGVRAPAWHDIRILVDNVGKDIKTGKITLKNDLPANREVLADPLIARVFFNLVDNAIRHGGKITKIRFSFAAHNGNRVIVCEDDGDGVASSEKEKIFDRGFGKNTGFGLTISREILDITGMTIKETGKPGKGARFEIVVPEGQYRSTAR
jgi:PAS domain S-box-containing protein